MRKVMDNIVCVGTSVTLALAGELEDRQLKLVGHRWMEKRFTDFKSIEDIENASGQLQQFKESTTLKSYQLFDQTNDTNELVRYLENGIIDYYYKKSLERTDAEQFELRYINKN